ncbi:MAG TPA: carboxy terminal-processing peptidase [Bacteroidia bacterium]|jgi:carboxyl-terminal processing protease|nr:carboxy terminal-processing peptidase [Bacteroidia bacterium]
MIRRFRFAFLAIPIILGIAAYTLVGSRCANAYKPATDNSSTKEKAILDIMMTVLQSVHYSPIAVNDTFSEDVFNTYINRTDYSKKIFLQTDIDELKKKYYNDIDDEVKASKFDFFNREVEIVTQRIKDDRVIYHDVLAKPFDFSKHETIELDPEKYSFPKNAAAMHEAWRLYMKYLTMVRFVDSKKTQDAELNDPKNIDASRTTITLEHDSAGTKIKTVKLPKADSTLEREAREKVLKTEDDIFDRLDKVDRADRMSVFMNVVVGIYDPHTEFFPPAEKDNFDIQMSGQLEGIGATLQEKDGYIKVTSIVTGSPCWKQGDLKVGDLIIKVAQGAGEPVDISGMRVDDAVKLIRGKKGTEVRLTVKKPDGSIIVIPLVRDVIILEETFAQSAIIKQKDTIGYLRLPSFYADFTKDKSAAHNCSDDVKKELIKLKAANVKGVILDLRDNGGGSLYEVIRMMGLFIPNGPVVQVKSRDQGIHAYNDDDKDSITYDGPLVVLINENSASASEILAAAIQDYHRGVIIGSSSSTFGKGTVQNFYDLDKLINKDDLKPLGQIKVTIQKFYRVNGGSTQLKGVTPDIRLPGYYDYDEQGEKDLDYPMGWDQIPAATYTLYAHAPDYNKLKGQSDIRVAANNYFTLIKQKSDQLKREKDATLESLYLDDYKASQAALEDENKKFKPLEDPISGMTASLLKVDADAIKGDSAKVSRKNEMLKGINRDPYISEAAFVISDIK